MTVKTLPGQNALRFIILLGIVSLFSDMVYEGARSITGPYLAVLGASGTVVGVVAGFGEAIGYMLRIISGWLVDKSERYWLIAFIGYLMNFIALPMLALATTWQMAAILIIIERIGKAIRTPARDAMLSYASQKVGRGWGFGLHQVLDQLGGMIGPTIVTAVIFIKSDYQLAFAFLAIPAVISFFILLNAKHQYPNPQHLEIENPALKHENKLPENFWIYLAGTSLIAAGYVDFPLVAYHFEKAKILTPLWIPIFYIFAMGSSAASALFFGWIYDRFGGASLMLAIIFSAFFPPFVFLGGFSLSLIGMVLWGIGIGAQRSLLKAVVGDMVTKSIRATAYGVFNTGYGFAWFLGSALMGYLYDVSIPALIAFSIIAQLISLPFIYITTQHRQ
ncbi:MAG TPA: MFS transporter [Gammaproteobacteria bacterium]|nr:MFS transporter [Gammaproteobacteria bacterium]